MQIKKGTYRISFIFKRFVIKIPKILSLIKAAKMVNFLVIKKNKPDIAKRNLRNVIFCGIFDNWEEFKFYRKNKSLQLLVPTYFSFFGLFNVQEYCMPFEVKDYSNFWGQIKGLTNNAAYKDSHAFSNPANYGTKDGRIRMFDYGSEEAREVLKEYAEVIFEGFKFWHETEKS